MTDGGAGSIFDGVESMLDDLEAFYKDVHRHPELSMQEERTAALAAERLQTAGLDVTVGVGKRGVVGLLRNGDGPTVMLRADMDALPVQEQTGLDYASETEGVMHACGHDMHVAWLAGAAAQLAAARKRWHGTLMAVFQPAEETAAGAQAMIGDGLFDRFAKPDVILGQHVMPSSAGTIGTRAGVVTSAADSFEIRMFGRGAHGSMPRGEHRPRGDGGGNGPAAPDDRLARGRSGTVRGRHDRGRCRQARRRTSSPTKQSSS
jgi:hippurate hydrolase